MPFANAFAIGVISSISGNSQIQPIAMNWFEANSGEIVDEDSTSNVHII